MKIEDVKIGMRVTMTSGKLMQTGTVTNLDKGEGVVWVETLLRNGDTDVGDWDPADLEPTPAT